MCVYLFIFLDFFYSFLKVSSSSLVKALLRDCSTWPSADNRNQNVRVKNGSVVWLVSLAAARLNRILPVLFNLFLVLSDQGGSDR